MDPSGQVPRRRNAMGALAHCARSLYLLLGNRRKFERAPISSAILATYQGPTTVITRTCSCVDISPRGIAIDSLEPMEPNTLVALHSDTDEHGAKRCALVRYCRERGILYRIGLEFLAEAKEPGMFEQM
jgi:hypothetical protein